MNSSARHHLLEDALLPGAMADSLASTHRAARHRRIRRRTGRTTMVVGLVVAAGLFLRHPVVLTPEAPIVATAPAPAPAPSFVLVTTLSGNTSAVVHTVAVAGAFTVSTRDMISATPRASEDDLFALAGSRPAALHRLPDGSTRWMWLDEKRRF